MWMRCPLSGLIPENRYQYNIQVVVVKRLLWTHATCFYRHNLQILECFEF